MSISEQARSHARTLEIKDGRHFPELCEKAERRLIQSSLEHAAMTIVDDNGRPLLVYKFIGKPVGLAKARIDGLEPYHWYTPDQRTKEGLDQSFDLGNTHYIVQPGSA